MDLPPLPEHQAPAVPSVPAQRPGAGLPVPASVPTLPPRRRRNWRLIIAIIAAALADLCAAGSLTGYLWYGKAVAPDRSTPSLAVRQYLQATFEAEDSGRAGLFTCGRPEMLSEVQDTVADIRAREARFGVRIVVAWEGFSTTEQGSKASVSTSLLIRVPEANGSTSESLDHWIFTTVKTDGWRVCGAHRVD